MKTETNGDKEAQLNVKIDETISVIIKMPLELDVATLNGILQRVEKIINAMRKNTNYFIICHNEMWFIPQTKEEGDYYESRLQSEIAGMKDSIKRCREYIENKEWKNIEAGK